MLAAQRSHWVTANEAHVSGHSASRANGGYVNVSRLRPSVARYGSCPDRHSATEFR
jgi:hypothetical protein